MCGPIAAALPLVAASISAAGTLVGGVAANAQGRYQSRVMEQNARMSEEAAQDSVTRGQREARQLYRQISQTKGAQNAAMAANGIDLGFGSALRTQQDTALMAQEDAEDLYSNIDQRTRGFFIDATNNRAEGRAAKYRGQQELVGSFFKAGATLAGGASQMSSLKKGR